MTLQTLIRAIYPPQCVLCEERTDVDFALCGPCWAQTPFIDGVCCDACGTPLQGQETPGEVVSCDDCMGDPPPWSRGRAAMIYDETAKRFVLSLKHGDRTDLARAAGPWLARAAKDIISPDTIIVPMPLHRHRLLKRRFNQAALLGHHLARITGARCIPDALLRPKKTAPLGGHTRDQRFVALCDAIMAHPKRVKDIAGRNIVMIDDVMTTGASFGACTGALYEAGAKDVCVLALARTVKDA